MICLTASLEAIGVGASVVAALAAVIGVTVAWHSGKIRRITSRDSLDAIALGITPTLHLDTVIDPLEDGTTRGRWAARTINASPQFAATDVHLEASFQDGHLVDKVTERVAPGKSWLVVLREIEMPPGGPSAHEAGRSLVLRYSDERHIARYEQEFGFVVKTYRGEPSGPTISVVPVSETVRVN
jgi:hypothetical protein